LPPASNVKSLNNLSFPSEHNRLTAGLGLRAEPVDLADGRPAVAGRGVDPAL